MKKFKKIYIEITNICNMNCSFCPKHKRPLKAMTPEEFEQIVAEIHPMGENFYLHLMGEPTGHPQFGQILDVCNKYGIKTNITTNGTLLARSGEEILNHNLRNVSVSLHSFEANSLNISLQKYLGDITDFCKKALGGKTVVELRLWNMSRESLADKGSLNYQIVEYLNNEIQPDCDIWQMIETTFFSMEKNRKKNFRLKENIFLGMAEQFSWPCIEEADKEICKGFCYGLRNQVAILSDGTIVPCCLDSDGNIALGNIFDNKLQDVIQNDRSRALYDGFTNQKAVEPLCRSCGYMKKYFLNK